MHTTASRSTRKKISPCKVVIISVLTKHGAMSTLALVAALQDVYSKIHIKRCIYQMYHSGALTKENGVWNVSGDHVVTEALGPLSGVLQS